MIKSVSLQTTNIDDMEQAVSDLASQLREKLSLLRNSVGIVQCDPEFVEAGIMPLLHDALGIDMVGGTTVSVATNDIIGNHIFSLMVLTSDDVEFYTGHTNGVLEDCDAAIERAMCPGLDAAKLPLGLALIFPTVADSERMPGDCYVEATMRVCGDVPVFGTLSVDDTLQDFDRSMSVHNSEAFARETTFVLMFGDVKPKFFVATVPRYDDATFSNVVITKSDDNIVQEINNMTTVKFFESVGMADDGALKPGVRLLAYTVTHSGKDGVSRSFVRALSDVDENGHGLFRGKVPVGSTLTVESPGADDILDATIRVMQQIAQVDDAQAVLIYSCIVRQLLVGADTLKELAHVKDTLQSNVPFVASYSGGEIGPIGCGCDRGRCDKSINAFHNYSLIACVL